jgi:hypothetical protein
VSDASLCHSQCHREASLRTGRPQFPLGLWQGALQQRRLSAECSRTQVPAFEVYYDTKALWPAASVERLEVIMASANSDT